jgi:asparagine synthetase B (glutamine-hydrolysing)
MDPADWPASDGSSGITSSRAMDDAEAAGRAVEVGSNFFVFFSSGLSSSTVAAHAAHHAHPAESHSAEGARLRCRPRSAA